jgi:hypothetical protein
MTITRLRYTGSRALIAFHKTKRSTLSMPAVPKAVQPVTPRAPPATAAASHVPASPSLFPYGVCTWHCDPCTSTTKPRALAASTSLPSWSPQRSRGGGASPAEQLPMPKPDTLHVAVDGE